MLLQAEATSARPALNERVSFELTGSGNAGQLRVFSPLGTTLATASWAPGQVLLQTSEGEQRFADLEQLSRQTLGEALPLAALPDWLAGRPWTEAPHQLNSQGFEQSGWRINLQQRAQGWIEANRQTPPALKLRIKLEDPR
jgi:outer membrane lipoprotein LolB